MNITMNLLRRIGSPFVPEQKQTLPENKREAQELYAHATKNKIGLLYLESLKNQEKIEEFGLESEYREESEKHEQQVITAIRVAKLLNSFDVNYVVFKSFMPYSAVPNDVDIVHLGSEEGYKKVEEMMVQAGYIQFFGIGKTESQVMFHDSRGGDHLGGHEKDIYDIDIYRMIAASHIIYLDKKKFVKYVTEMTVSDVQVKVLEPEAELVAIITHSIIPEQLCTLSVYYAMLHYLAKMNHKYVDKFVHIVEENDVIFLTRAHCSLVAELHQAAHGFVPEKLNEVLIKLGGEVQEKRYLIETNFKMPHLYSRYTIIRALLEKTKEKTFRKSVIRQGLSMLNPMFANWVISEVIRRRRRETY